MNNLGEPFALGRTAEIYEYGDGKVLKLFLPTIPQSWIDKEVNLGRYIQATQLPVPKVYERVKLDDREGVVYERIEGPSLLTELAAKPWNVVKYANLLAELHVQVHEVKGPSNLETQREWAKGGIPETNKLPKDIQNKVIQLLDTMPVGDQLCHGDFHPGNIVVSQNGPIIIDWMTASRGTASGDVARTATILEAAKVPEGTPMRWLLEWIRKIFLKNYLNTYLQLRPEAEDSLTSWGAVMAANFLADVSLPEEEANLLMIVENGLRPKMVD